MSRVRWWAAVLAFAVTGGGLLGLVWFNAWRSEQACRESIGEGWCADVYFAVFFSVLPIALVALIAAIITALATRRPTASPDAQP